MRDKFGMTRLAGVGLLLLLASVHGVMAAEEPLNQVTPLPGTLQDHEMLILEVILAPGQASMPHRHNAHTFVYVLEGEVEMQVRGGPLLRLGPGGTFYESPADIHQVSRNASSTRPAKILVHLLKPAGTPVSIPAD